MSDPFTPVARLAIVLCTGCADPIVGTWDATTWEGEAWPVDSYTYDNGYTTHATAEAAMVVEKKLDASLDVTRWSVSVRGRMAWGPEPTVTVYAGDVSPLASEGAYAIDLHGEDEDLSLRCQLDGDTLACTDAADAAFAFQRQPE